MFTVCPKCALTLVVTAADLRVAQGYVRCGRCSNVFNALARLSEDRDAAAAAQTQAAANREPTLPTQHSTGGPGTGSPEARGAQTDQASTSTTAEFQTLTSATSLRLQQLADAPPDPIPSEPIPSEPIPSEPSPAEPSSRESASHAPHGQSPASGNAATGRDEDIPDDALEFKPEATDLTKVFVEQAPSAEFRAATGTFQALRLEAEEARAQEQLALEAEQDTPSAADLGPVDTQVDVEIDPDLLATMAQLGTERPREPNSPAPASDIAAQNSTSPATAKSDISATRAAVPTTAQSGAPRQSPPGPAAARSAATTGDRPLAAITPLPTGKATSAVKPAPPPAQAPQASESPGASSTPMAARARARVEAARPSFETTQAIRSMLARKPRRLETDDEEPVAALGGAIQARLWIGGSALMALLLLVQVVHHYRNDLAANAHLNRPLTALYSALGMRLIPRWNLGAYEVRQLGASTAPDAPGQITVRASVKNDADQSQPMPLLRVTLQDRFGNRIAARDVPPRAYLPGAARARAYLSAGQRVDAEMAFVDPGANAVGFEIDACLLAPGGVIACANDMASR
ncbi:MAG TPA: DUF3426 domain-containing protein [Steroidobacteraceae bacterium]|jgi:predicted Zn finger-like uncharacterized protein